jgi:hypothetical protein
MGHTPTSLRVVRLLHQASYSGLGRCRQRWADKSNAGHHQGQSFHGSRPLPPTTARIITEPPGSLTVIPPAITRQVRSALSRRPR